MDANASEASEETRVRLAEWRAFLLRDGAVSAGDVDELEDHLRSQIEALAAAGLDPDEAFLVAARRIGKVDRLTREFAREHSDRLWKQLVPEPAGGTTLAEALRSEAAVALGFAVLAGIAIKMPALLGVSMEGNEIFYVRNVSLFVLPCLAGYFGWKRGLAAATWARLAAAFALAAVFANVGPADPDSMTTILTALHLPIALWLAIGVAYAGGRWNEPGERMNFIRYSGELVIYFALIALGGVALTLSTMFVFLAIDMDAEEFTQQWLIPCGAVGAVIVSSWLVEAKKSVVENMAPVLTRVFAPLFTLMLLGFLGTMAWTGKAVGLDREVLIGFDLLLVLVLCLLLYAISARETGKPPGAFDALLLVLVLSALAVDLLALTAIAARISEFGFSPNKLAALGENLILLMNLAWSAWLYARFLRGQRPFADLERWQTAYLPVFPAWAAIVAVAFPPLFGYV